MDNIFWIVFYKQKAIGCAKIQLQTQSKFLKYRKVCKLQKLYILKDYVSKGIEAQLQKIIINKAIGNSYEYIWLSVLKSN